MDFRVETARQCELRRRGRRAIIAIIRWRSFGFGLDHECLSEVISRMALDAVVVGGTKLERPSPIGRKDSNPFNSNRAHIAPVETSRGDLTVLDECKNNFVFENPLAEPSGREQGPLASRLVKPT